MGCFLLFFIDKANTKTIKNLTLLTTLITFDISIVVALCFNPFALNFQMLQELNWLLFNNNQIILAVDGLSITMILLTTFLMPICILLFWANSQSNSVWGYCFAFLTLEFILLTVFSSLDLLIFYILFEAVLIPMYFIVGFYGSRQRKIRAAYMLFLYTLVSSILMFISILFIYLKTGSTNYLLLRQYEFDLYTEYCCWLAFFSSFAVKMPLMPFHIWLPEAHCEAPTAGSVLLAGILLKLGGYGFLRYSITLFTTASAYFVPLIFILSVFGVLYASLTTLQQVDLKKIVAYSSVGHMGLVTIGIFSLTIQGIAGSIVLMLAHGISSSALFICIGFLYERYKTRIIKYYSGIMNTMPLFSICFIVFNMANLGLPLTSNFIGEFLVITGCFPVNNWVALLAGTSMVISAGYSLWLCNRVLFGNFKYYSVIFMKDLTRLESFILLPFVILTFIIGLYPEFVFVFIRSYLLNF